MGQIEKFEDIRAWQEARQLAKNIHAISKRGKFGRESDLRKQVERASALIMANVAKGFECNSNSESMRFLEEAKLSAVELQSLLYIALDGDYIDRSVFEANYLLAGKIKGFVSTFRQQISQKDE